MKAGAAVADITPDFEVELCGFAARTQPAIGVREPIFARALYLDDGAEKLLWIAADVLAFERSFVESFRNWCGKELGLESRQVLLAATHTHNAPTTLNLTAAGCRSERFCELLTSRMQSAARRAVRDALPCTVAAGSAPLELAIDRRKKPSAHTDPFTWAIRFIRQDGSDIAAVVNYPMHPVAFGHVERQIGPDWCGAASSTLSSRLPGRPVVLVVNGAAGNLNPPAQGIPPEQVRAFGERVAGAAAAALADARAMTGSLAVRQAIVPLPLDTLDDAGIDRTADAFAASLSADHPWKKLLAGAANTWREAMKATIASGGGREVPIELQAIRIGDTTIVTVNGEIFSRFSAELRKRTTDRLFVVGYANTAFGYIPTREAYAEGGYEPDQAHFFYNSFRPRAGGLELLVDRAVELVKSLDR